MTDTFMPHRAGTPRDYARQTYRSLYDSINVSGTCAYACMSVA